MAIKLEPTDSRRKKKEQEPVLLETILGVLSVLSVLIGVLLILAIVHAGGTGGEILFIGLTKLFGVFAFFMPFLFFSISYYLWKEELPDVRPLSLFGSLAVILGFAGLLEIFFKKENYGGLLGVLIDTPLLNTFSVYFTSFLLFGFIVIGAIVSINRKPALHMLVIPFKEFFAYLGRVFGWNKKGKELLVKDADMQDELMLEETPDPIVEKLDTGIRQEIMHELVDDVELIGSLMKPIEKPRPVILTPEFIPPPLDLLNYDSGKSGAGDSRAKMATIQRTLEHFRIHVEMGEVTVGPTVTQFTLKPAQGVNLSKIVSLHDNLAMELGAEFLRIEAPIPGKTLVGVEVPNERKATLGLRSMLELPEFKESSPLTLAIGKSIIGKPIFGDLTKMPHLLVAGATRTGKSVTLQNLLISLLYKNSPYDLKLIILDPKRVEFTAYNHIPHLYTPIIKEPKSAIKALNWAVQELERRYEILAEYGQVNVEDYNKKILSPLLEKARKKAKDGDELKGLPPKMPYIIIIFDEYNDFMLSYPKEISPLITALSQKGRAAGVHLILSTQRPDVKVITGTIKANIPARIALKTTSQVDSRTILDASGAEDLLGNGDMLYMASDNPRLVRLQAPFVSTEEIKAVVQHIKESNFDFIPDHIDISKVKAMSVHYSSEETSNASEPEDDEDYMSAKDFVISTDKASTSSLQTAFRWGYNKAARIMGDLERYGIIGPARSGERYREILQGKETQTLSPTEGDETLSDIFSSDRER